MFTPPASPRPNPGAGFSASQAAQPKPSSSKYLTPPSSSTPTPTPTPLPSKTESRHLSREDTKRRIGRRFRNAVILVPLVLIVITATARMVSHGPPYFLSSIASPPWSKSSLFLSTPCHEPHHRPGSGSPPNLEKRSPQLPGVGATTSSSSTPATSPTGTVPTVASIPTVPQTAPVLPTPFPQAFNGIITKNFSSISCMNFITDMTNAREFRLCRPFSLLLQSSDDFVAAQNNLTLLNDLVWGTCNTNAEEAQCVTNMATFATNLRTQCTVDLIDNNAVATSALKGLESYALMRESGCLTDPTTNTYCFVNAAADTNPTNLYYYNLPAGINLPSSSDPQCTACLKSLMSLYGSAMKDESVKSSLSALRATYERAAELTLGKCGVGYAQANLVSAAVMGRGTESLVALALSAVVGWLSISVF